MPVAGKRKQPVFFYVPSAAGSITGWIKQGQKQKIKKIKNFQKIGCFLIWWCYNKGTKEKEVRSNEIITEN